ncbi:MAG: AmmeMemoRadiSam system protein B [Candidatus Omnitrophota bacterium]
MRKIFTILIATAVISIFSISSVLAVQEPVKEPNVSGYFYPSEPKKLSNMIDQMLEGVKPFIAKNHIYGIISPHAGYIYSGLVAANAYKAIYRKNYSTVIILSPSHHQYFEKAAVYKSGSFKTPLGLIPIDSAFTNELLKNSRYFDYMPAIFEKEHALEVQLPFLQKSLDNFSIVPIIISSNSYSLYEGISDVLAKLIAGKKDVLIVASTDMSHFHEQVKANSIDKRTLSFITDNDAPALFDNLSSGNCELCGQAAVITLMLTMKKMGANQTDILDYATSADTADSSKDRVVGYCSVIYSRPLISTSNKIPEGGNSMLTQKQKKELLSIARESILEYLKTGQRRKIQTEDSLFLEKRGAFVTLKKSGMLRGCIGRIVADEPLINVVCDMAIEAATGDPRFPNVKGSELDSIDLEISVMSPIEQITDISKIKVGTHGIIIKKGFASGLLLPQVAAEYAWNTEQFLEQTCIKAGLNRDDWKKGAKIFIFSAEVFGEKNLE